MLAVKLLVTDRFPHTITLDGLPGVANGRQAYEFWFGYPPHISGDKIILHIPEHPNRSAEGRPRYPEQADWIRKVVRQHHIRATEIWHSHWQFETEQAYKKFVAILQTP